MGKRKWVFDGYLFDGAGPVQDVSGLFQNYQLEDCLKPEVCVKIGLLKMKMICQAKQQREETI